ncbi:DUF551 domain-containing protein [Paraburkholderia sp. UCT31]|uniref:DUF551 domain-containing protein n=1 Tax=Paraburkholderia sp. UCT31 TaxID=2615209 RepID=UPI0016565E04|nr:DUF551 domain-containing protein [Paraburkholderia sp. UCT31]MBC8737213.1 DUF551 domain-containing protein [Paraburkholderia sp. UCT31]
MNASEDLGQLIADAAEGKVITVFAEPTARRDAIIEAHLGSLFPEGHPQRKQVLAAAHRIVEECFPQIPGISTDGWIPLSERMPAEGLEVFTLTEHPDAAGDAIDTDWLEQGFFAGNKGRPTHWRPKYPEVVHPPRNYDREFAEAVSSL